MTRRGDRWAALEPIQQGIRTHYQGYARKVALELGLRHDWGLQYAAHQFQGELSWLGIQSTPSYVGEPECNGIMERWMRTLKEECIYLHDFESLEQAREIIGAFIIHGVEWDGMDDSGSAVAAGVFLCQFMVGGRRHCHKVIVTQ